MRPEGTRTAQRMGRQQVLGQTRGRKTEGNVGRAAEGEPARGRGRRGKQGRDAARQCRAGQEGDEKEHQCKETETWGGGGAQLSGSRTDPGSDPDDAAPPLPPPVSRETAGTGSG